MFKYFAVVFAALLAVVAAKPGYVAPAVAYTAAGYPTAYSTYAAPALAAYSAPAVAAYSAPAVAAYSPYSAYSPYYAGYGAAYRYY